MLDFVFAVSHPDHWHSINIHQHKDHYSSIARLFGSNIISILQNKVGAGVWFNVECLVNGRIIKYGVVSVDTLVKDLMDWETLYMAGRMHKPINVLRDEPRIRLANQVNLSSAVRASLLLLPETFSEEELYSEITSLSYRGDFRMAVGENPNKIKNIVATQGDYFQKLYQPILRSYHRYLSFMGPEGSGSIRQDNSPKARAEHARRLPLKLREMVQGQYERESNIIKAMGKKMAGAEVEQKPSLSEETAQWVKLVSQGSFKHNLDKSERSF
jgi:translocator assembly and maintenance protein 41